MLILLILGFGCPYSKNHSDMNSQCKFQAFLYSLYVNLIKLYCEYTSKNKLPSLIQCEITLVNKIGDENTESSNVMNVTARRCEFIYSLYCLYLGKSYVTI